MMSIFLNDLSTEILINVFQFCDIPTICRLRQTCRRFNKIIETSQQWITKYDVLVTNQIQSCMKRRSALLLTYDNKWRISHFWKIGKYTEKSLLYERENFLPWLNLTKDHVWLSRGQYIKAYKRRNNKIDVQNPVYVLSSRVTSDISKFVKTDDYIISGQWNGSVWIWSQYEKKIVQDFVHESAIYSVDIHDKIFVTGTKDHSVRLWSTCNNFAEVNQIFHYRFNDRLWDTSFSPDGTQLAIGTSGCNSVAPLHIFDVNVLSRKHELGKSFPRGSGILDSKWLNNDTLLTGGYDACVRKWDLRTGKCEQIWEDPFFTTVYCLDTDNACTLITGTQSFGRVVLFDMRQRKYVQFYFMASCKKRGRSSPAYSVSFDATQLFVATDQHLSLLDFTDNEAKIKNYTSY